MNVSRIYRLLRVITMLQSGRSYTAGELAEELEVSRRTIFRDLNVLEMARIPYYFDAETRGYKISQHFFLPPVNLTIAEALAMLILTGRTGSSHQLPLLSQGARAAAKVESILPTSIREHVGNVIDRVGLSLGQLSRHEGMENVFDQLMGAIASRKVCRLVYISFHEGRQIVTTIRPLRLIFLGRAWYLLAYSASHRQTRIFKLGRIRKLTVTKRTFEKPKDVDLEKHFGDAWCMIPEGQSYDVHLHFEPKVAGNVAEVHWHHTQRVEWNPDGSLEFHAQVDGLGEITWWILGYGDQVRAVSPPALKNRIRQTAAAMLAKYDRQGK